MIFGLGSDITSVKRIVSAFEKSGDRFARRILSKEEYPFYVTKSSERAKITFLAKRFAAKEAISKALGTGMRQGIGFLQFTIVNNDLGKPEVELTGKAKEWAEKNNISRIHLTLSDEQDYAIAFAVAEAT